MNDLTWGRFVCNYPLRLLTSHCDFFVFPVHFNFQFVIYFLVRIPIFLLVLFIII